jgi:hypothetical protein
VATTADGPPDAAEHDPVVAPLLADARARGAENTMIFRETFGVPGAAGDAAIGVLNLSAVLRSGLSNVERSYIVDCVDGNESSLGFLVAVGAVRREDLDADQAGRRFVCWMIDHGSGGMLGQVRDVIRAEAGMVAGGDEQRDEDLLRSAGAAVRAYTRRRRVRAGSGGPAVAPVRRAGRPRRVGHPRPGRRPPVGQPGHLLPAPAASAGAGGGHAGGPGAADSANLTVRQVVARPVRWRG